MGGGCKTIPPTAFILATDNKLSLGQHTFYSDGGKQPAKGNLCKITEE